MARYNGLNPTDVGEYFEDLVEVIQKYNITAENTYNLDEHSTHLGTTGVNDIVFAPTDSKKKAGTRLLCSESRGTTWVSFLECIRATGSSLSTMMIFAGQNVLDS